MKNKTARTSALLLTMTLAGAILSACGLRGSNNGEQTGSASAAPAQSNKPAETATLTLGMLPSIDALPFIIAHKQGFDVQHGVNLDIETFKSAKDRDAAFQAGKLEGWSADLIAVAIYNNAGMDVKIASTTTGEFDLLTGNDAIQDIKDLKGKSLILSKNTSTEYTVASMLKQAGLSEDDVTVTEVPQIPTRLELLANHKSDAAILPEPYVTMGQTSGLRVLGSTETAGVNPFVLAIPQKVIDAKPDAIRAMYAAYNDAVSYMKSHDQSEYVDTIIQTVGYPESLKNEIKVPDYAPAYQVDPEQVEAAFAWAREKGLLTKDLSPEDVISDVQFKN